MRLQLHWNNIEWVDTKTRDLKKNQFCSKNHKFYNKYGIKSCHFVGHFKLKPIEHVEFFKHQHHIDAITVSIASITVTKTKKMFLVHLLQVSKINIMKLQVIS